jgi:hypothetical protein
MLDPKNYTMSEEGRGLSHYYTVGEEMTVKS